MELTWLFPSLPLLLSLLSISGDPKENRFTAERDEYGADTMSEIQVVGRITLNLWRVMKTEVGVSPPFSSLLPLSHSVAPPN